MQIKSLVEPGRIELPTSCVQGRRSPSWAMAPLTCLNPAMRRCTHNSSVTCSKHAPSSFFARLVYRDLSGVKVIDVRRLQVLNLPDVIFADRGENSWSVLEYTSVFSTKSSENLVGLGRFELPTSPLSGVRSNQLSYRPEVYSESSNCADASENWDLFKVRRWSSRRFPYGYLVTTSPQSWITPW